MIDSLHSWLVDRGLGASEAGWAAQALAVVGLFAAAWLAATAARLILGRVVSRIAKHTSTDWDDVLVTKRFFSRLAHIAPAIVIWRLAPAIWPESPGLAEMARRMAELYMLVVAMLVLDALLDAIEAVYQRYPVSKRVPITGYVQIVKLLFSLAIGIAAISLVINKSPIVLLSGLGAVTAIILLIFKDTILGFVAGIHLAANDMVRPGDWIEMSKYGADGDVISVGLTTVKVQNWDKTITTIPTYALMADSFRNWRGMSESGGRRIKRAIVLDVRSIRFCTPEMIERFRRIQKISDYVANKQDELERYNRENGIDDSVTVNGRRMTNLGTFRAYVLAYLRDHPKVDGEMTLLVRQLPATDKGLPLELYLFSNDQAWANYEAIQSDIFDHLFAVVHEFGLRPFQAPSGHDIAEAATSIGGAAAQGS